MTLPPQATPVNGVQGTIAEQPAATNLPDGTRYIQTDGVEQYVDGGVWVDVPSGGGGGTVEDITSTGASIDVTDPTGPTTNLEVDPAWLAAHAVTSLDGTGGPLEGDVTLSEGTGIALTQTGQNIEIAATGAGSALEVTDGSTSVLDVVEIIFTGANVTDEGSGVVGVTITAGAVSVANFGATFQSLYDPGGGVLNALGPTLIIPVDPVAFQYGAVNIPVALPLFTYPPGAIAVFGGWNVNQVDTTNDPYDIRVALIISDATGTNSLVLQGAATANAGTPGDAATINPGDLTVTNLVGTDLSYDTGTGEISSAAGGVYWIQAIWNGDWD